MSELTCGWTVSSLLTLTRIQGKKKKKKGNSHMMQILLHSHNTSCPVAFQTFSPQFLNSSCSTDVSRLYQQLCCGWAGTWEEEEGCGCTGKDSFRKLPLDELFMNASLANHFLNAFQTSSAFMGQNCATSVLKSH